MPSVYETLRSDIIQAMKARDSARATILRTADAAIQRASMDQSCDINEDLVINTLKKSVKNLKDANTEFSKAGRTDLVEQNEAEILILEKYLPQGLSDEQIAAIVSEVIQATGAQSKKEMGKVMGALKSHPQASLIDFAVASKVIQSKLS